MQNNKVRKTEGGINWIHYKSETREDALAWYKERHGCELKYPYLIYEDRDGMFSFSEHR